jgi:hypothetical protein
MMLEANHMATNVYLQDTAHLNGVFDLRKVTLIRSPAWQFYVQPSVPMSSLGDSLWRRASGFSRMWLSR